MMIVGPSIAPPTAAIHPSAPHSAAHSAPATNGKKLLVVSSLFTAPTASRAPLATTRRLITSLLNEGLLVGRLLVPPTQADGGLRIFHVGLFPSGQEGATLPAPVISFYAVDVVIERDQVVTFCDPEDFVLALPVHVDGEEEVDPVAVFNAAARFLGSTKEKTLDQIRAELRSSRMNQELSFGCLRDAPSYSAPGIEWESAIIEGHSVHPMHRSRLGLDEKEAIKYPAEFNGRPEIHFVSMPASQVRVSGDFYKILGAWCPAPPSPDRVVVPIHEGQWKNLVSLFPDAVLMGDVKFSKAQTSLRSVCPDDLPYDLKFALAVTTTSALRTVSPYSVYNGPRVGAVAELLAPPALKLINEVASVGSNHPDPNVAKHLACLIRERPETIMPEFHHIIAAGLIEKDKNGVPNVITAFQLDSEAKREAFLSEYIRLFLDCFIPPMLKGLAFEAHGQNVLARFTKDGRLDGFSVRDFGGLKCHLETIKQHTGVELDLMQGSSIVADTMEDAYRGFFHAGIQNHLHRIIRALGLHRNGKGWAMARENLRRHLQDNPLLEQWSQPRVHVKSLMSMKLGGLYRDFLYYEAPNFLVKEPSKDAC